MSDPPPYKTHPSEQESDSLPSPTRRIADEEYGFWGEEPVDFPRDGDSAGWGIKDVLRAGAYALLAVVLALHFDVFGARWDLLGWSGGGNGGANGGNVVVQGSGHVVEIYLCRAALATDSGNAGHGAGVVGSERVWHVISSDAVADCGGEVVMLLGRPADQSMLHFGDEISLEGATVSVKDIVEEGEFLEGEEKIAGEKEDVVIPDDLAEEGLLRLPVGSHMHAGFGGPWRSRQGGR